MGAGGGGGTGMGLGGGGKGGNRPSTHGVTGRCEMWIGVYT